MVIVFMVLLNACGIEGSVDQGRQGEQSGSSYHAEDLEINFGERQAQFSLELFQQVLAHEGEQKNIMISPLSVSLALALAYNGAEGETRTEMGEALGLQGLSLEQINQGYSQLKSILEQADSTIDLRLRESIWTPEDLELNKDYLKNLKKYYHAETQQLDFSDPKSVDKINKWVKKSTNNKIEEIVDQLDPNTVMLLLNTVYFLGDWTTPFEQDLTETKDFHLLDGSSKKHPLMKSIGDVNYFENELFQSVQLPYGEEKFSMYVFLPQEDQKLAEVSQALLNYSAREWQKLLQGYSNQHGTLELPRFELEYDIELTSMLKSMGMEAAFTPQQADFSNMLAEFKSPIDEVKHKTYIRTDEKGTEAAGATMIAVPTSLPMEQFSMIVDRPFMFMIQEKQTGVILFMGSIVNPEDVH